MTKIGIDPDVAKQRSRVALAGRRKDPEALAHARLALAEAKLAAYITETVNAAPAPLSSEQRARLTLLLRPAGGGDALLAVTSPDAELAEMNGGGDRA